VQCARRVHCTAQRDERRKVHRTLCVQRTGEGHTVQINPEEPLGQKSPPDSGPEQRHLGQTQAVQDQPIDEASRSTTHYQ
jgi:hypothetical protein